MIIVAGSILLIASAVYLFTKLENSTDIIAELKNTFSLWFLFWLGMLLEIGVDYLWKRFNGNVPNHWLPDSYWLLIQFVLAIIVCVRVYIKLPRRKNIIFKTFLISVQVIVNFMFFMLAQQYYISGSTFLDSM
jgi:hypothetical protein